MHPLLCGLPLLGLGEFPLVTLPPGPPAATKAVRDAFGDFDNVVESPNFAVKWGSRGSLTQAQATDLADSFEVAWAGEIDAMGFPAPSGTDRYKFNVYLGDSGDGAPASYGAAGYYTRDRDGQPYIVIAPDTIRYDYYATTAAHEFFHAVQDTTRSYSYDGVDAWFWEATAMWMEGEVYPDDPDWYSFLFGYALLPQYPVWYFDYPDTGALGEYHQYGAAVWPRYLTEHVADAQVVYEAWVSDPGRTPNDGLAAALDARGLDVATVFADFAAHNAVMDYADGRGMDNQLDQYEAYFRNDSARVVDEVGGPTEGLVEAPADTLPEAYGVNTVEWRGSAGRWVVTLEGETTGSEGSAASWGFTVVTVDGAGITYLPVSGVTAEGVHTATAEVELGGDLDEAWIVAAVLAEDASGEDAEDGETWAWRYGVAESTEPTETTDTPTDDTGGAPIAENPRKEDPAGCGCVSGGGGPVGGIGLVVGALVARRRRRHF